MRNTNKKGFTIIELVIVIAVIAILAAVLIPTFAGIIAKANESSDIQATRQMNTALAVAGDLDDIDDVIDALAEAGFNSKDALIPVSTGYTFYWYANAKQIVLENDKGEVVFPEGVAKEEGTSLENSAEYIDVETNDSNSLLAAVTNGNKDIKLSSDITVTSGLTALAGSEITLDLGGNTLSTGMADATKHQYALNVYGTVTLTNGTVDARGIKIYDGGKLILGEGVTVNHVDDNGGACLWVYEGAEVVIDGGTFIASKSKSTVETDPAVISNFGGKITINDGKFETTKSYAYAINNFSGEIEINGGEFSGYRGVVAAPGGKVTINSGKFAVTGNYATDNNVAHVVYAKNGNVVINGGTFTGGMNTYCVDSEGTGSITLPDGTKLTAGQYK